MAYENRGSARQRGYDSRWERARLVYLRQFPLCVKCEASGLFVAATVVDHIVPHRGDQVLFWDSENNWQSLCKSHHDSEKQSEERLGYSPRIGADGWPLDPAHPANTGKSPTQHGNAVTHPRWFRPVYVPLTIVCGAPGSGKSYYVRQHAGPKDRIICFDIIACRLFGQGEATRTHAKLDSAMVGQVLRARNEELADLMRASAREAWSAAWLVVTEPTAEGREWWAEHVKPVQIVVMATPAATCKARVASDATAGDARHSTVDASIDRWWSAFSKRAQDTLVVPHGGGGLKV